MSESLISLTKHEPMSESLVFLSESLISSFVSLKTSDSLGNPMSKFPALTAVYVYLVTGQYSISVSRYSFGICTTNDIFKQVCSFCQ